MRDEVRGSVSTISCAANAATTRIASGWTRISSGAPATGSGAATGVVRGATASTASGAVTGVVRGVCSSVATVAAMAAFGVATLAGCAAPAAPRGRTCPTEQVVLAGQDDVVALAGCRDVAALRIRTAAHLDFAPLATLERIRGAFVIGPTVGVDEIRLPNVVAIDGELATKDYNGDLRGLYLPALVSAHAIRLGDNHALATVSLPRLRELRSFVARRNPALEMIDLSALAAIDELVIVDNSELALVEAPNLAAGRRIEIDGVPKLGADVVEHIRALGGR